MAPLGELRSAFPFSTLFPKMVEKTLRIWFLTSLCLLIALGGWSMGRFGVPWASALTIIGTLTLILLIRKRGRWPRVDQTPLVATYGVFLCIFVLSVFTAQMNLRINDWMEGSITYLEAIIDPVIFSADSPEEMARISLSAEEEAELREKFSELRIYDEDLPGDILVSFEKLGLALIEGKAITPLAPPERKLSMSLPDGSVILYDDPGNQVFARAVVQDNALYEMWERRIPPTMYLHHWGDEFEGELYHPIKMFISLPDETSLAVGGMYAGCRLEIARTNTIGIFDASTGELKRHIAILPQIAALGKEGNDIRANMTSCEDVLHLNKIRVIKEEEHAQYFPHGKVGDLLISMRGIDTIALLDRDTSAMKWHVTGQFSQQHEPIVTDRGTVILFDNLGSNKENGASRIVEIEQCAHTCCLTPRENLLIFGRNPFTFSPIPSLSSYERTAQ